MITLLPNLAVRSRPDFANVRIVARETPTSVAARATETAIGLSGIAAIADAILHSPPSYCATSGYTPSVQDSRGCLPRARRRFCGRHCLLLRTRIPVTTERADSIECRRQRAFKNSHSLRIEGRTHAGEGEGWSFPCPYLVPGDCGVCVREGIGERDSRVPD